MRTWELGAVVKSQAAGWLGKALYYLLPNLAPFRREGGGRPRPAGVRGVRGVGRPGVWASSTPAPMIALAVLFSPQAGLQVTMNTRPLASAGEERALALLTAAALLWAAALSLQAYREARQPLRRP